jgi:hypothetical protein
MMWCIPPEHSAEFVCAMETVLDVYQRPYDPEYPVVCMDETSKQLVAQTRQPLPPLPGEPERYDYEYERHGTANIFMFTEPLKNRQARKERPMRNSDTTGSDGEGWTRARSERCATWLCDRRFRAPEARASGGDSLGLAKIDCEPLPTKHNTVGTAVDGTVIHEYQSDSSSKRPASSVSAAAGKSEG